MNIEEIDKNLRVAAGVDESDILWRNARDTVFSLHGLYQPREQELFMRMDPKAAQAANMGVAQLNFNTAGGRLRFATDSAYVALHAEMDEVSWMPHMTLCGSAGFDMYVNGMYNNTFIPPPHMQQGYCAIYRFLDDGMREVCINFPLYNGMRALYVGLQEGAQVLPPQPYALNEPVVYYGSSITQGGCASRPGNSYPAIISQRMDLDHINLGFSGSARGEESVCDYIKQLSMCAFVYDYDHNAPTAAHLRATHEPFFLRLREAQPELPMVMVTMPSDVLPESAERRDIIRTTYENAVARGDRHAYYIDGRELFGTEGRDACTVDGVHPNDLGFYRMAQRIEREIRLALSG